MRPRPRTARATARGLLALGLVVLTALAGAGEGGAMRDLGDYTVHYNAMPASALDPVVAERYGLPRSDERCVVTVAVTEDASGTMVEAGIMASATRPDGRMYQLDMRAITDDKGVYYVGELPLDAATRMDFRLQVQPRPDMPPQTIHFQRELSPGTAPVDSD